MYRKEKPMREERYRPAFKNPSFSSTLLDEIYRSIDDDGDTKHEDLKFYREEIVATKQSRVSSSVKISRGEEGEGEGKTSSLRRACLIEKWMDQKASQNVVGSKQMRQNLRGFNRNSHHQDIDLDQDALFFSSTSTSSDSSSGGFSSSDTESFFGSRSKASSFGLPRPKPVRTSVSAASKKSEKTERTALFYEQREVHTYGDFQAPRLDESLIKSKSRALKIYSNLKKVKQPISPGGKLTNFINSLFSSANNKKSKNSVSVGNFDDGEMKIKPGQASTCSSASSFSRSCLSKHSPSTREKLRNGDRRTVRFYPVSVIVDEDCRPCGQKSLNVEDHKEVDESSFMALSLPTAWKIGKSPSRKIDRELKCQVIERSRRVEEVAREFLRDYHHNAKKNDVIMRDIRKNHGRDYVNEEEEEEEDDDAASYSSSDLFELDHLAVIGNNRYSEELPVYETTHVHTNRAIANGLIM